MLRWKIAQAAEIRWWQNYLKRKKPAEYLAWKSQYWRDFLQKIGLDTLPTGATCLDAGSSLAGIFMVLEQQKVKAIDPLMSAYQEQLPAFFERAWYPHTQFETQRLEDLADENAYDVVFCLNVINHVADIKDALRRLWQALRSGGRLVLSIDAHNYKIFKYLFRIIPADILHPHQYDLREYQAMLQAFAPEAELKTQLFKREFFFNYHVLQITKP
jgi:2-polyprenyl-3-methyl-5-hydroxy-6-metoxy-1,4-benzoquinol methylase